MATKPEIEYFSWLLHRAVMNVNKSKLLLFNSIIPQEKYSIIIFLLLIYLNLNHLFWPYSCRCIIIIPSADLYLICKPLRCFTLLLIFKNLHLEIMEPYDRDSCERPRNQGDPPISW